VEQTGPLEDFSPTVRRTTTLDNQLKFHFNFHNAPVDVDVTKPPPNPTCPLNPSPNLPVSRPPMPPELIGIMIIIAATTFGVLTRRGEKGEGLRGRSLP